MTPGTERKKAIIDHILIMGKLPVNRKYCLQTREDVDLFRLLKKGTIKQIREVWRRHGNSYVVLT
jgi:hypothetical protein